MRKKTDKPNDTNYTIQKVKFTKQLLELNEQGQNLSSKVNTLQEIVKIHWASTLIDYIDEKKLLDEVGLQKQNNGETIHPLAYNFGEISNLFQFVCEEHKGLVYMLDGEIRNRLFRFI